MNGQDMKNFKAASPGSSESRDSSHWQFFSTGNLLKIALK